MPTAKVKPIRSVRSYWRDRLKVVKAELREARRRVEQLRRTRPASLAYCCAVADVNRAELLAGWHANQVKRCRR